MIRIHHSCFISMGAEFISQLTTCVTPNRSFSCGRNLFSTDSMFRVILSGLLSFEVLLALYIITPPHWGLRKALLALSWPGIRPGSIIWISNWLCITDTPIFKNHGKSTRRKDRRTEKEGWMDGWMDRQTEGWREGGKEGGKEGRKEGRKKGRKEGRTEGWKVKGEREGKRGKLELTSTGSHFELLVTKQR